jgi:hypothetical protein
MKRKLYLVSFRLKKFDTVHDQQGKGLAASNDSNGTVLRGVVAFQEVDA